MDRALRIEDLELALGVHPALTSHSTDPFADTPWIEELEDSTQWPDTAEDWEPALPTVQELQQRIAATEVQLFLNRLDLPEGLLRAAWYLHGVASASEASQLYSVDRQRRAFSVSAHIFDLSSGTPDLDGIRFMRESFAAQVGYYRSEKEPNAAAIGRRAFDSIRFETALLDHIDTVAIEAGVGLLGMQLARFRPIVRSWRSQFSTLASDIGVPSLVNTMFGPSFCVVEGVSALLTFLTRGERNRLAEAQNLFETAVRVSEGDGDHDARWVASHLRFLADEMEAGSVWTLLPDDVPDSAKQAFTLTEPTVLTLWKPQRELLTPGLDPVSDKSAGNALDSSATRIILSVPTSAGKTLMSQLLMVGHLATDLRGVCYVSPQRSLGREVRRDLSRRLRFISREVVAERPDFGVPQFGEIADLIGGVLPLFPGFSQLGSAEDADVTVMTPEALDHAIREDADELLLKYGLFVFDEAHLLAERSRGFKLEALLSFLHWRTRYSGHRIVLLSAAMGNAGHLAQWLSADDAPILLQSDWRGPRRLHGIFNAEIRNWSDYSEDSVKAKGASAHLTKRLTFDNFGVIRLRVADGRVETVETTEPVGKTVFRATVDNVRERRSEPGKGTPQYKMLAEVVDYVGHAGPVLVICSTRADAVRMAKQLAVDRSETASTEPLALLAEERLGDGHSLPALLRRGVAYHHAGIPGDIQEAIEEAVRADLLRYIVATSTLTEGVNLPVRTVVIGALPYEGQPVDQQVTGARLVNAIGRAGRATKETEGWVILHLAARPSESDFSRLEPTESDLEVRSTLATDSALEALATFEDAVRQGEDAIFAAQDEIADFASFAWFILSELDDVDSVMRGARPVEAFQRTLAFYQLEPDIRERYERAFDQVQLAYDASDAARRRQWARTGTSVSSARILDGLADRLVVSVNGLTDDEFDRLRSDAFQMLEHLRGLGMFGELVDLKECPRPWRFRQTTGGQSPEVTVDPVSLMRPWIGGASIVDIANGVFGEVSDPTFRLESTVLATTDFCEHFFSWMLSAVIQLANCRLEVNDRELSPDLAMYVRYGVSTPVAAELRIGGLRSRETSSRISGIAADRGVDPALVLQWLRRMTIEEWRTELGASESDVHDMLDFVRVRNSELLRSFLSTGEVIVGIERLNGSSIIQYESEDAIDPAIRLRGSLDGWKSDLFAVRESDDGGEGSVLATVPVSLHLEIEAIIGTGLDLGYSIFNDSLRISDLG